MSSSNQLYRIRPLVWEKVNRNTYKAKTNIAHESVKNAKAAIETLAEQAKQILDPPSMRRKWDAMVSGVRFVTENYRVLDDIFAQVDAHAKQGDFTHRLRKLIETLAACWPEWEANAGQAAQQAQHPDAGAQEMFEQVEPILRHFAETEMHNALRIQGAKSSISYDLLESLSEAVTDLESSLSSIDEKAWPSTAACIRERIKRYRETAALAQGILFGAE